MEISGHDGQTAIVSQEEIASKDEQVLHAQRRDRWKVILYKLKLRQSI